MALRYLFIDFDSFFASVEQQYRPELRGKPVAIVPSTNVETTCCIAASYEAKAYGVKTGTGVREARYLCPDIRFVEGNHTRYTQTHQTIKKIVHQHIYIDAVPSIDEMYGRLPPRWQAPAIARKKAYSIKCALAKEIGPSISASIGIAPNRFLAKLASKMEKPDGLVLLDFNDIPEALYRLELVDFNGIGQRMHERLKTARITTVEEFFKASRRKLHRIWGSIEGDRMWYGIRGIDLPPIATHRSTIGHSHVLPPRLQTHEGAQSTLHRMLQKAARRLRAMDYYAGHLDIHVKFGFDIRWHAEARCFPTQDSITLADLLNNQWAQRPQDAPDPTKVAVTLMQLTHADAHTPSLFPEDNQERRVQLQREMDKINKRYGGRMLYYADSMEAQKNAQAAPMRIAFNHIPDLELESD